MTDAPPQHASTSPEQSRRAVVITASNRASAGVYPDRGGPLIAERLTRWGFSVSGPVVVPDGDPVGAALREAVTQADLVLTTGGTGVAPGDRTPEATRALLDAELPGIAEEVRRRGAAVSASALLSRAVAGVAGRTIVVNLPGSAGGVRDGLAVLGEVLDHLLDQLSGGDHS